MRDINESIANAIEIGVSKYIEKYLEKDTSICVKRNAQIKEALSNNRYVITIDGCDYTVKSKNSYSVNDIVNVLTRYGKQIKDIYILPWKGLN